MALVSLPSKAPKASSHNSLRVSVHLMMYLHHWYNQLTTLILGLTNRQIKIFKVRLDLNSIQGLIHLRNHLMTYNQQLMDGVHLLQRRPPGSKRQRTKRMNYNNPSSYQKLLLRPASKVARKKALTLNLNQRNRPNQQGTKILVSQYKNLWMKLPKILVMEIFLMESNKLIVL